jgi:hypothetical protein
MTGEDEGIEVPGSDPNNPATSLSDAQVAALIRALPDHMTTRCMMMVIINIIMNYGMDDKAEPMFEDIILAIGNKKEFLRKASTIALDDEGNIIAVVHHSSKERMN